MNHSTPTPSASPEKWWRNPQGIVASATIAAMLLGFFYVREKQMWEVSARVITIEQRGDKIIQEVTSRLGRIEQALSEIRDRANFLERQIDRLEIWQAEEKEHDRQKGAHP